MCFTLKFFFVVLVFFSMCSLIVAMRRAARCVSGNLSHVAVARDCTVPESDARQLVATRSVEQERSCPQVQKERWLSFSDESLDTAVSWVSWAASVYHWNPMFWPRSVWELHERVIQDDVPCEAQHARPSNSELVVPATKGEVSDVFSGSRAAVPIDDSTTVPPDVFDAMLKLGFEARDRSQHCRVWKHVRQEGDLTLQEEWHLVLI